MIFDGASRYSSHFSFRTRRRLTILTPRPRVRALFTGATIAALAPRDASLKDVYISLFLPRIRGSARSVYGRFAVRRFCDIFTSTPPFMAHHLRRLAAHIDAAARLALPRSALYARSSSACSIMIAVSRGEERWLLFTASRKAISAAAADDKYTAYD